jgi:hypothetical protein
VAVLHRIKPKEDGINNKESWDSSVCWHCGKDHAMNPELTRTFTVELPEAIARLVAGSALVHGRTWNDQIRMMLADYVALGRKF